MIYTTYTLTLVILQTKAFSPANYKENKILGEKKKHFILSKFVLNDITVTNMKVYEIKQKL